MKYIIFDLDGTLADISLRRKKARKEDDTINWSIFFDPRNIQLDSPIESVLFLYHSMILSAEIKVVIFSGRSDVTKQRTFDWFSEHDIVPPDIIEMRKDGDYTPDEILKKKWLYQLLEDEYISKEDILFVVDDRNKVVKMWREEGLTCLQCAEGDF
jgi:FMN phosphatase YigB (HAD superfamily)